MEIYIIENPNAGEIAKNYHDCFSHAVVIAENEELAKKILFNHVEKHLHSDMNKLTILKIGVSNSDEISIPVCHIEKEC